MKKLIYLLMPVALIFTLSSCIKREINIPANQQDQQNPQNQQDQPALSIGEASVEVFGFHQAFNKTLVIAAQNEWNITVPTGIYWISVTQNSGSGKDTVTISVSENTSTGQRSAELTVSSGNTTKVISVIQGGMGSGNGQVLEISAPVEIYGPDSGFSKVIGIKTKGAWNISIPNDMDWISLIPKSGSGDATFTISASKNDAASQRFGVLTISSGNTTKTITVIQAGSASSGEDDNNSTTIDTSKPIVIDQDGKYLDLSATQNDYMLVSDRTPFYIPSGESYSITLKVNNHKTGSWPGVLSMRGTNGDKIYLWRFNAENELRFGLFMNDQDMAASFETPLTANKWYHVAIVIDKGAETTSLYLNGEKVSVVDLSTFAPLQDIEPNTDLTVGVKSDAKTSKGNNFHGDIDDLRFWKKALTKKEIYADAANITLSSDASDLKAAYNFNNVSGTTVPDASGNGHDGTLYGDATVKSY